VKASQCRVLIAREDSDDLRCRSMIEALEFYTDRPAGLTES